MVKFLVEAGIDSISVNADMAKEISDYVAELETGKVKGTDEEPRKYEPEKKTEEFVKPQNLEIEEEKEGKIVEEEVPKISGVENLKEDNSEKKEITAIAPEEKERVEEDIKIIEKEKEEYLKQEKESGEENTSEEDVEQSVDEENPEFTEEDFPEHEDGDKNKDETLDIF